MEETKTALRSPAISPALSPSRSPGLSPARSPNRSPNRSPGVSPKRSPCRSPQYGSPPHGRHRSASIPVTPDILRGVQNRFLNAPGLYSLGEYNKNHLSVNDQGSRGELPKSAPELRVDEVGPSWTDDPSQYSTAIACTVQRPVADIMSRRFSETLTVSDSWTRRRRQKETISPQPSRSQSFRTPKKSTYRKQYEKTPFRPRGNSVPTLETQQWRRKRARSMQRETRDRSLSPRPRSPFDPDDEDYYMLRNFSITSKGGVVNHGDLYRHKSRSNNSVASTVSSVTGGTAPSTVTSCSSSGKGTGLSKKVLMLGAVGVGKTAIVTQFMSSEYMNAYDCSMEEDQEKNVSILLDGDEYELTIIDPPIAEDFSADETPEADAYIVVYSTTDRSTFEKAVDILFRLREKGLTLSKAVILVGNKSDLVRSRIITTEEGKSVACTYESKFTETSAAINHQVDELLVGIVTQIRLKANQQEERNAFCASPASRKRMSLGGSGKRAKEFLNRLLGKGRVKSQSCGNLQVL